ncbi:MAG: hypothetical protein IKI75_11810 [Lachnospiraceae bacterium]|nr:hypothetical protein [Lachnospiraceae bacterium]
MLMFLVLAGAVLSCFMIAQAHKKGETGRMVILGLGSYISAYAVSTALLMLVSAFTIEGAAALAFFGLLAVNVVEFLYNGMKLPKLRFKAGLYFGLAILLLIAALISGGKTGGYFGTGQDQGLYQSRAMFFINGKYDENVGFPEYKHIHEKWERSHYYLELKDMRGYYIEGYERGGSEDTSDIPEDINGVIHGVGTFPALLALWGKLFGLEKMCGIQTLCYLLSIANVWLICRNLRFRKSHADLAALMYAAAPIVLWSSENSLTEVALAMFITLWFAILTGGDGKKQVLGALPLAAYCMTHMMCVTVMPMIVILYFLAFIRTGRRSFPLALILVLASFGTGYEMMMKTAEYYTSANYANLYGRTGGLINEKNIGIFVWGAVTVCAALCVLMILRGKKAFACRLSEALEKSPKAGKIMKIVCGAAALFTIFLVVMNIGKLKDSPEQITHLFLYAYMIMTGFACLPLSLAVFAIRGDRVLKNRNFMLICVSLYYIMWVYIECIWWIVNSYFYYARYLTPFIFLPLLAAGIMLKHLPMRLMLPAGIIATALMMFQSRILYLKEDNSMVEYRIIKDVASCLGENDCVLINEQGYQINKYFTLPLRALTDADIYFVNRDRIERQLDYYGAMYQNVFLLSFDLGEAERYDEGYTDIYKTVIKGSVYEPAEDGLVPYPKKAMELETPLVLKLAERDDK